MECKPTIMGIADATHYLVGGTDLKDNFVALPQFGKVAVCNSLLQAKQLLRQNDIEVAQLLLESAYDEMCGLSTNAVSKETVYL